MRSHFDRNWSTPLHRTCDHRGAIGSCIREKFNQLRQSAQISEDFQKLRFRKKQNPLPKSAVHRSKRNNASISRTNIDIEATDSAAAYLKGVLSDDDLATQRLSQAAQMQKQAEQLLAEAKRLTEEAQSLTPAKNVKTTRAKKATPTKKQAA